MVDPKQRELRHRVRILFRPKAIFGLFVISIVVGEFLLLPPRAPIHVGGISKPRSGGDGTFSKSVNSTIPELDGELRNYPEATPSDEKLVSPPNKKASSRRKEAQPSVLAHFTSFGGHDLDWVDEDFSIRFDNGGNLIAPNPSNGFEADFSQFENRGLKIRSMHSIDPLQIELSSIGHGTNNPKIAIDRTQLSLAERNRVEFDRGRGITEWFNNGKSGLEQGWTIQAPLPGADSGQKLRISLEVAAGDLKPGFQRQNKFGSKIEAVTFSNSEGVEAWRYGTLKVWDASGSEIPSWIEPRSDHPNGRFTIDLVVAAADAEYPLTIDPLVSSVVGNFTAKAFSSSPREFTVAGGKLFFVATDEIHGRELWVSDGTAEGTVPLDIFPGSNTSAPRSLIELGGKVYFQASDGINGIEPFVSDGSPEGTHLLKDINPGFKRGSSPGSIPSNTVIKVGGNIFFLADDGTHGYELWVTDGTSDGTRLVKDVSPGDSSIQFWDFVEAGGKLFFKTNDGIHGTELWVSDGTEAGTFLVKDIRPGAGSAVAFNGFARIGNQVVFEADDGIHGDELWISDGTDSGTFLLSDINSGSIGSSPAELTEVDGNIFFRASDGIHGAELWSTDGTTFGTRLVEDILPGASHSYPSSFTGFGGQLFFVADDGVHGSELWSSDGTADGTSIFADIQSGPSGSNVSLFTESNGNLFFSALDGTHGTELWKTDGTQGGTGIVKDLTPGVIGSSPSIKAEFGGGVIFETKREANGRKLWISDGTSEGTLLLKNTNSGLGDSSQFEFTELGDKVYFRADDGRHGEEIWVTDGTPDGTRMLKNIQPGGKTWLSDSYIKLGEKVIFGADDGVHGYELWITDGTSTGTEMVCDIAAGPTSSVPYYFAQLENKVYFRADDGISGSELWVTDGTPEGTELFADIGPGSHSLYPSLLAVAAEKLFFRARGSSGYELWTSDGTLDGFFRVKDINPGIDDSSPLYITAIDDRVVFSAEDGANGRELWVSDGTEEGTFLLRDIHSGEASSNPANLTDAGGKLFFSADDGINGNELWITDGTADGTVLVSDIKSGLESSDPTDLSVINGEIFFLVRHYTPSGFRAGFELWKSDGTSAGTSHIENPNTGSAFSASQIVTDAAGNLWFAGYNSTVGHELWVIDNSSSETRLVKDINPGSSGSSFSELFGVSTGLGQLLFFGCDDSETGLEPWISNGTSAGTLLLEDCVPGLESSWPSDFLVIGNNLIFTTSNPTSGRDLRTIPFFPSLDLSTESDTGESSFDHVTANVTPTITGSAAPGTTVALTSQIDGPIGSAIADMDGNWNVTSSELSEGNHEVIASAPGYPDSIPLGVEIDVTPPTVTVNVADGQNDPSSGGRVHFTAEFSEPAYNFGAHDILKTGTIGGSISLGGGPSIFDVRVEAFSSEGFVSVSIPSNRANDLAGNANTGSSSIDNRVDIDTHPDQNGAATVVPLSEARGTKSGFLYDNDTDTFSFTISEPRITKIFSSGNVDTTAELRNSLNELLNSPSSDDDAGTDKNFLISRVLTPGEYKIAVSSRDADGDYDLHIDGQTLAVLQPDLTINGIGRWVYATPVGQTTYLVSKKARPVNATAFLSNEGNFRDVFSLQGHASNAKFRVSYTNPTFGNITAAVISGRHQTDSMEPADPPYRIEISVNPERKKIRKRKRSKQNGRTRKKIVFLKKRYVSRLTATSNTLNTQSDLSDVQVRTR